MHRSLLGLAAIFACGCLFDPSRRPPPAEWLYAGPLAGDSGARVFERYERRKDSWRLAEAIVDFEPDGRFDIAVNFLGEQFGRQIDIILPAAARADRTPEGAPQRPDGREASPILQRAVKIAQKKEAGLEAIRGMREGLRDDRWLAALALYLRGGSYAPQLSALLRVTDEPAMIALALAGQGEAGIQALAKAMLHPWPDANWPARYLAALGKRAAPALPIVQEYLAKDGPHLLPCLRVLLAVAEEDRAALTPCAPGLQRLSGHPQREVSFLAGYLVEKLNENR